MKPLETHLTEDERHAFADGALSSDERASAEAHMAVCESCASDVARIATLMKRIHETPAPTAPLDDLWPTIRGRIEATKLVPLATDAAHAPLPASRLPLPARGRARWFASIGVIAAAAIIAFAVRGRRADIGDSVIAGPNDTSAALIAVVDSAHAYEEEARTLLDRLELQRAMLRPDAAKALDHDLHVVDVAIAELKDAVARDPNNPALRQLLATSYRQKVDLLKRIANAS
jgi:anti-sigma factor RsiW